jgi:hypothetical protein
MRIFFAAAIALVSSTMLASCASNTHGAIRLPQPFQDQGVKVVVDRVYYEGTSVGGVTGVATNTTAKQMGTLVLYLDVVDAKGARISQAVASTYSLAPGEPWRFEADFVKPFAAQGAEIRPGQLRVYF